MPGNYLGLVRLTTAGATPLAVLATTYTKLSLGAAVARYGINFAADLATIIFAGDYLVTGNANVDGPSADSAFQVFLNGANIRELTRQQATGAHSHCCAVLVPNLKPGDTLGLYAYNVTARNWTAAMQVVKV